MILDLSLVSEDADVVHMAALIQSNTNLIVFCEDHKTSIHVVTLEKWREMWLGQHVQVNPDTIANVWVMNSDTHPHVRVFDLRAVQAITTV